MTVVHWSVRGQGPTGREILVEAYWCKHAGHRVGVSWRSGSDTEWRPLLSNRSARDGAYGPYADEARAVRAAKRQRRRLKRDEGVVFDEPQVLRRGAEAGSSC